MKKIQIKGKDYVEVHERIKFFRENFKDYALLSEMISNENGVCIFKSSVINPDGITLATGYAYEKDGSSFINKTSYIENCETSSWGRALGNFGIGIDTSIASYEEVANAVRQQEITKLNGGGKTNSKFETAKTKALNIVKNIKDAKEWEKDLEKLENDIIGYTPEQTGLLYHAGLKAKCIDLHTQILWNDPELDIDGLRDGMASDIRTLKYIDLKKLVKELEKLKGEQNE